MAGINLSKTFREPLGRNNPVFSQILGICSTLAVTNSVKNTFVMVCGLLFTTTLSSFIISLIRKLIPTRVRMMAETLVIAALVIIVDTLLRAYQPTIWRQLGPYVGLIITNCIVMGRLEAFSLQNPPLASLIDGFSSGLGYGYVLLIIAVARELLGSGKIWGISILGDWWRDWTIMVMPPGAFFMLAVFIWVVKGVIVVEKPAESKGGKK